MKTLFSKDSRAVVHMNAQWCDTIHKTYKSQKTPTRREEELGTKIHQLLGEEESVLFKSMATIMHNYLLVGHTLMSIWLTLKGLNIYKRITNEKTNIGEH